MHYQCHPEQDQCPSTFSADKGLAEIVVYLYILFMDTHAHAEQHREPPLAIASLSSHNSACCACHLLDAATNLLYISKVVTGRNSNTSLPPEGSEDTQLWQNSSMSKTQTCPSGRSVTSLTESEQAFPHHVLLPLVTEIQCPQ